MSRSSVKVLAFSIAISGCGIVLVETFSSLKQDVEVLMSSSAAVAATVTRTSGRTRELKFLEKSQVSTSISSGERIAGSSCLLVKNDFRLDLNKAVVSDISKIFFYFWQISLF